MFLFTFDLSTVMKINEKIGLRISQIRKQKGLSIEQIAEATNIKSTMLLQIEEGKTDVEVNNLSLLADALNVPVYYFLIDEGSIFEFWDTSIEEIDTLIKDNPSLRGFVMGYLAEYKVRDYISNLPNVSKPQKFDDHDRGHKNDLVIEYKGKTITIEIKSLQTNSIKRFENGSCNGTFQCDASDRRTIQLADGREVTTTCLRYGDFDIVAVNLFYFHNKWEFAFARNKDLPCSESKIYPPEIRSSLIKSSIRISDDILSPFTSDPITLFEEILKEK